MGPFMIWGWGLRRESPKYTSYTNLPPGKLHFCNWYQQEHRETKPEMVADLLLDAKEARKDTGLGSRVQGFGLRGVGFRTYTWVMGFWAVLGFP